MSVLSDLQLLVNQNSDSISSLSDGLNALSENFSSYQDTNDSNISDLQMQAGQLSFPMSPTTNQILQEWLANNLQVYGGVIQATASSASLPVGWTVAYDSSTQIYTITHNLNLSATGYAVIAMPVAADTPIVELTQNADNFQVYFNNSSGTFSPQFNFIMIVIQ